MTLSRPISVTIAIVGALALAIGAACFVRDWSWFRGIASSSISEALGRDVSVGRVLVALGSTTWIGLEDVTIANAPPGTAKNFARADRIDVAIRLPALLNGRIEVPAVILTGPKAWLERDAGGAANWTFRRERTAEGDIEVGLPQRVTIRDGSLSYRDRQADVALDLRVATSSAASGSGQTLVATGTGRFHDGPFEVSAEAGSLVALAEGTGRYPVNVRARIGENDVAAAGTLGPGGQLAPFDLRVDLKGPDLSGLAAFAGFALPKTPPYEVRGRIVQDAGAWELRDFSGRLGQSVVGGALRFDTKGPSRPWLTGNLVSETLDLDDFAAFFGPGDGKEETASETTDPSRVIPDLSLDVPALKTFEANVQFHAKQIANAPGHLATFTGRFVLEEGKLTLDDVQFAAAGGLFAGSATLDTSRTPAVAEIDAEMRGLGLDVLLPENVRERVSGKLGGRVRLSGKGPSLQSLLKTLDGRITLFLGGGRLNALLAEAIGLDILGTLRRLVGDKNDTTRIRCMVADFPVQSGVLQADALVLDTNAVVLTGTGTISLPEERLDLTLSPRPRGASPLSFSTPLKVSGDFNDPQVSPQPIGLGFRAGTALALSLFLGPVGALVPMVESGLAGDTNCRALLRDARSGHGGGTAPPAQPPESR